MNAFFGFVSGICFLVATALMTVVGNMHYTISGFVTENPVAMNMGILLFFLGGAPLLMAALMRDHQQTEPYERAFYAIGYGIYLFSISVGGVACWAMWA